MFNWLHRTDTGTTAGTADDMLLPRGRCAGFLVIESLRQNYGTLQAIDDVSLTVAPGEILCLLGASGCGKSTLLRLIAGVERPSEGRILLDGREVCGPDAFVPPEERGVGLVFQDYALFPHLSVVENVMFGLSHLPKAQARTLAMRALARVALTRYAEDYPHRLSGGEQQRVALARALAPRPSVLLMDEPFSNLDQRLRETIREETVALLRDEGISAVIVTHDPEEAMQLADTIALMDVGRIVQTGTPQQLYHHPASDFVMRFFCDINEIKAVCTAGRIRTAVGEFAAPKGLPDGPCLVCIRPEAIIPVSPSDKENGEVVMAQCLSRQFLGAEERIRLRVDGLDRELNARMVRLGPLRIGQHIPIRIDAASVLVFESRF